LDSATALYQAKSEHDQVAAVSFTYGSLHESRELTAAMSVADAAEVDHIVQHIPDDLFRGAGSALMGETSMPNGEYNEAFSPEGPSPTVVPFRNAVLISMATAIALTNGYDRLYAGMHASDHNRWAYPDCSPEFLGAMANAVYVGTMHEARLVFPFVWMTKANVVARAHLLGVPAFLTYSCYRGRQLHCGTCPTCIERIKAFREAELRDPVHYEEEVDWGDLPDFQVMWS